MFGPMSANKIIFVETRTEEKRALLCRWAERFYEKGNKVQILTDSTMAAQHLDELLWKFSQGSFVPHRIISPPPPKDITEPVVITTADLQLEKYDVLLADGPVDLSSMKRYRMVVHFVPLDDQEKRQESRLLWQSAKQEGFQLQHVPYSSNTKPV